MLIRYKLNEHGKQVAIAKVYTVNEHKIDLQSVDPEAAFIIEKLKKNGFEAYIVGGAVRDLILRKSPKDFDIATSASPKQIRKLFWNSRVIGRRFKLVHIYFQEKIFEVSTFRSNKNGEDGDNNIYGTIEEDAKRRDFTLNGLYYDTLEQVVLDFNDSFKDIAAKRMRSIIPLQETFIEDPVRMIRCIKYASTTGFSIPFRLDRAIKRHSKELQRCSSSRMTEEVFKILQCGHSREIIERLVHYKLFQYMLPVIFEDIQHGKNKLLCNEFYDSLQKLDNLVMNNKNVSRARMLVSLVDVFLVVPNEYENSLELFRSVFKQIKQIIAPITPPNYEVERAVEYFFRNEGIKVPKHAVRKPKSAQQKKKPPQYRKKPHNSNKKRRYAKREEHK